MALRALVKATPKVAEQQSVVHLYRAMVKELPRVMTIYDIDLPLKVRPTSRSIPRQHPLAPLVLHNSSASRFPFPQP